MTNNKCGNVIGVASIKTAEQVFIERLSMVTEGERDEVLRRIAAGVVSAGQREEKMTA
ncbi:MAG: hypothetical protein JWP44_4366 [Mucilaginibacter sp.]|nr:hypothetical protein [Mucilaginibacter sp.]